MQTCSYCWGTGKVSCDYCEDMDDKSFCPVCGGSRVVICPACHGTGRVDDDE